eukprot:1152133-Rhodomonas_salina.2
MCEQNEGGAKVWLDRDSRGTRQQTYSSLCGSSVLSQYYSRCYYWPFSAYRIPPSTCADGAGMILVPELARTLHEPGYGKTIINGQRKDPDMKMTVFNH